MSIDLVQEAIGHTPIVFLPNDTKVMIHPVVPDEERPVDLSIVRLGGHDLPDMGVIVALGWKVNLGDAFDRMKQLAEEGDSAGSNEFARQAFYSVGDVVAVNKYSGMNVPGTQMVLIERADILGRLLEFPVRLKLPEDVAEKVREARAAGEAERSKPSLVLPG